MDGRPRLAVGVGQTARRDPDLRILLTNDDGVHAPGLAVMQKIASQINGGDVEVWTIAPMSEMSGVAHCISYTKPVRTEQLGDRLHAVDGTPADTVLVALYEIMAENPPDLVLSGVNRGNNIAENTLYSGTVGAAIEAVLHDGRAIAMSQFLGPKTQDLDNEFDAAQIHGPAIIDKLLNNGIWRDKEYGLFYNVNFPPCPAEAVRGHKVTVQGFRPACRFKAVAHDAPNRRRYYWLTGGNQQVSGAPGTDAEANLDGYIAITPARADLTAHDVVDDLTQRLT